MTKRLKTNEVAEFLEQSNFIENERSKTAFNDAVVAWNYIRGVKKIELKHILEVHRQLMTRLNPRIAGKWRTVDVFIGGEKKKYVSTFVFEEKMILWCNIANDIGPSGDEERDSEFTRIHHVFFEDVHPFEDGNGRVGRILYNWHRLKLGLPLHIIHEGDEQLEYYKWFRKT